jgi:hypothetical protein
VMSVCMQDQWSSVSRDNYPQITFSVPDTDGQRSVLMLLYVWALAGFQGSSSLRMGVSQYLWSREMLRNA